jgi:hypothetical protein
VTGESNMLTVIGRAGFSSIPVGKLFTVAY